MISLQNLLNQVGTERGCVRSALSNSSSWVHMRDLFSSSSPPVQVPGRTFSNLLLLLWFNLKTRNRDELLKQTR